MPKLNRCFICQREFTWGEKHNFRGLGPDGSIVYVQVDPECPRVSGRGNPELLDNEVLCKQCVQDIVLREKIK